MDFKIVVWSRQLKFRHIPKASGNKVYQHTFQFHSSVPERDGIAETKTKLRNGCWKLSPQYTYPCAGIRCVELFIDATTPKASLLGVKGASDALHWAFKHERVGEMPSKTKDMSIKSSRQLESELEKNKNRARTVKASVFSRFGIYFISVCFNIEVNDLHFFLFWFLEQ